MNLSLRFKIISITVAILVFAIAITTMVDNYVFAQEYANVLQSRALLIGQGMQSQLNKLLESGISLTELGGFEKQIQDTVDIYEDITYAMILDLDGRILFHNDISQHNRVITDRPTLTAIRSGREIVQLYSDEQGEFYDVFIPIFDPGGDHVGAIRLGFPVTVVTQTTNRLTVISAVVALASLSVAIILLVAALSALVTNPLKRLITAIEKIRSGEAGLTTQVEISSRDEIGQLGTAFNTMTAQLNHLVDTLEKQVADRTRQFETVAQITRRLAVILDLSDLLSQVVILIKDTFHYYRVQVYLLDKDTQTLQLAEGYGQAGTEMERQGHDIAWDSPANLVAQAARTGSIVQVDNVQEETNWQPNPLYPHLPDTRAEIAVPIKVAEQVVGVLDVQADTVFGLGESDANLLRSLADQLAVAIRNARLFEKVETALTEARALQERYDQQAWQKVKAATTKGQYLYVDPGITLDKREQETMAEAEQQSLVKNAPIVIRNEGSKAESLVAGINLRNKTIGVLQLQSKEHRQWTDDDMALVEAITDQLSQTAENLRLFEEAQDRAGREKTIREITDKLKTARNLDMLLETAARELGLRLGARHTVLEMGTERETNGADRHEGPVETGQAETGQQE